jgi:hypothetical protein
MTLYHIGLIALAAAAYLGLCYLIGQFFDRETYEDEHDPY